MIVPMTTRIVGDGGSRSVDELPAPTAPTAPTGPTAPTPPTAPTAPAFGATPESNEQWRRPERSIRRRSEDQWQDHTKRIDDEILLEAKLWKGGREAINGNQSSLKRSCGREGERQSTPINANQRQSTAVNCNQLPSTVINGNHLKRVQHELERLHDLFAPRRVLKQHEQSNQVRRQRVLLVRDHLTHCRHIREAIREAIREGN